MTLWQDHQSKLFTNAKAICDNADNQSQGLNWDQHYSTWHEFVTDEDNVWPIEKFKKDLNEGNRPQRPFDPKHLQKDLIELSLEGSSATVGGSEGKYTANIVFEGFKELNTVNRHKLVYVALDSYIKSGELHAISLKTHTKEEIKTQS